MSLKFVSIFDNAKYLTNVISSLFATLCNLLLAMNYNMVSAVWR